VDWKILPPSLAMTVSRSKTRALGAAVANGTVSGAASGIVCGPLAALPIPGAAQAMAIGVCVPLIGAALKRVGSSIISAAKAGRCLTVKISPPRYVTPGMTTSHCAETY
jgi:hypothetical protein